MFNYTTNFNLTEDLHAEVFYEAESYLQKDDMVEYLPENLKAKIDYVEWILEDIDGGTVSTWANERLSEEEEDELRKWIAGQCSDGLGEGFAQQPFAEYNNSQVSFSRADKYELVLPQLQIKPLVFNNQLELGVLLLAKVCMLANFVYYVLMCAVYTIEIAAYVKVQNARR